MSVLQAALHDQLFDATFSPIGSDPGSFVALPSGEIDVANAEDLRRVCLSGGDRDVIVDLALVTFMDCAAYRALSSARNLLSRGGLTMRIVGAAGQPAQLFQLFASAGLPL